jgi:peptidoglycan/LPS O-acetylase OafA/YrhL
LHFAWDRITRIYPVLWLTILCVLGMQIAFRQHLLPAGWIALSFLTAPPFIPYAHVNPIAWTLDYEVAFYAYCGACWAQRHRTGRLWPLLALPAIAAMLFFPRVTMMAVGAALGLGYAEKPVALALARYPALFLLAFLIGWHLLVLMAGNNVQHLSSLGMPAARALMFEAGVLVVSALGGIALLGMSKGYGRLSKLLSSRPMLFMGAISYSFYLWHIPIMGGTKRLLMAMKLDQGVYSQAIFLVISFALALPIAWLSYYFIEVRATGFLRKIAGFHPSFRKPSSQTTLEPLAWRET